MGSRNRRDRQGKGTVDINAVAERKYSVLEMRKKLGLSSISVNDTRKVMKRIDDYLEYCEEQERIPTVRGMCIGLGISYNTLKEWQKNHPTHKTMQIINQAMDMMADNIENGALKGSINNVTSIFLLKANHGYNENAPIEIVHKKIENRSLEEIENAISNEIIDADFTEK